MRRLASASLTISERQTLINLLKKFGYEAATELQKRKTDGPRLKSYEAKKTVIAQLVASPSIVPRPKIN